MLWRALVALGPQGEGAPWRAPPFSLGGSSAPSACRGERCPPRSHGQPRCGAGAAGRARRLRRRRRGAAPPAPARARQPRSASWRATSAACSSRCTPGARTSASPRTRRRRWRTGAELAPDVPGLALADALLFLVDGRGLRPHAAWVTGVAVSAARATSSAGARWSAARSPRWRRCARAPRAAAASRRRGAVGAPVARPGHAQQKSQRLFAFSARRARASALTHEPTSDSARPGRPWRALTVHFQLPAQTARWRALTSPRAPL